MLVLFDVIYARNQINLDKPAAITTRIVYKKG